MATRTGSNVIAWVLVILAIVVLLPLIAMIGMMAMGGMMGGSMMSGADGRHGRHDGYARLGVALDGAPRGRADRVDRLRHPWHQPDVSGQGAW